MPDRAAPGFETAALLEDAHDAERRVAALAILEREAIVADVLERAATAGMR